MKARTRRRDYEAETCAACRKRRRTQGQARAAAAEMSARTGMLFLEYRCPAGGTWHVGRQRDSRGRYVKYDS